MSVIINDFELVVDSPPPPPAPGGDGAPAARPPAPPPRPVDLRDALVQQARRAERLRAH